MFKAMSDNPQLTTNCFLNGKPYILQLTVSKLSLALALTNKNTLEKWKSNPSVEYIESMTRKTGNFKTFGVFTDMMKAVFLNASTSLNMKLLTQGELEKISDSNTLQSTFPENQTKKRIYFIMVYTSEFDRIHYPLPMDYAGLPNPEILQATIHGLENDKFKLLKELEQCKAKTNSAKHGEIGTLKRSLAETAKQCGDLGRQCRNVLEEFLKLKEQVDEEREMWRKELLAVKQEHERKLNSILGEVENLVCVVNSMEKMTSSTRLNVQGRNTLPRGSLSNQGDAPKRWASGGRLSDLSVVRSPRRGSPRRFFAGRPPSPSASSCGSGRDSGTSTVTRLSKKCSKLSTRTFPVKPQSELACANMSENEVNSVRLQIEALQRAVLGLSSNFKTTSI